MSRPPPWEEEAAAARGNTVLDFFAFKLLITHRVIQVLYIIGLIGITLVSVFSIIGTLNSSGLLTGLGLLTLGNIGWRLLCESLILFFSIHERLRAIEYELTQRPP